MGAGVFTAITSVAGAGAGVASLFIAPVLVALIRCTCKILSSSSYSVLQYVIYV